MNFTELKSELFARGTDYLDESAEDIARAERWLNQAYREICNIQAWPFLQATTTGTSGAGFVSVPDLRRIRSVANVDGGGTPGTRLQRVTRDSLVDDDEDLSSTGTPIYYYVETGNQVKAFPVGGTIRVDYIRRAPALSGTDTPLFSDEYHDIIIDRAMVKAYKDSDNFEAAAALQQEVDRAVAAMAEDYEVDSREVTFIDVIAFDG